MVLAISVYAAQFVVMNWKTRSNFLQKWFRIRELVGKDKLIETRSAMKFGTNLGIM